MNIFDGIYKDCRVLVTGHTGFKGSWLALWLTEMGANVSGLALDPESTPNHWDVLGLEISDYRADIRDIEMVRSVFEEVRPEIVFHLAAQPLVRRSIRKPLETWTTNLIGTANILEACRFHGDVRAVVLVTSDKCYENQEITRGYQELDRLGGKDPYSASKACSELITASYRNSYFAEPEATQVATARAGNVIGGGDWSEDRLIPDVMRAIEEHRPLEVRFPDSTRPWQHVLDSLSGYLLLGQKLFTGEGHFAEAWNFGPESVKDVSVSLLLERLSEAFEGLRWLPSEDPHYVEASLLQLDSAKARSRLHWNSVWDIEAALDQTATWYRVWLEEKKIISRDQLFGYIDDAQKAGHEWAGH